MGDVLSTINDHIGTAIALRNFMQSHAKHHAMVGRKIDNTRYAHAYNLIMHSHQVNLIVCVSRIWETDRDHVAISIPNVLRNTDWSALRNQLQGDRWERQRSTAIDEFREIVDRYVNSEARRAILVSRAEGIAHILESSRERARMAEPRLAIMGELYEAVDLAIEAYNKADLAINSNATFFDGLDEDYSVIHNQFFEHIPDIAEINRQRP